MTPTIFTSAERARTLAVYLEIRFNRANTAAGLYGKTAEQWADLYTAWAIEEALCSRANQLTDLAQQRRRKLRPSDRPQAGQLALFEGV